MTAATTGTTNGTDDPGRRPPIVITMRVAAVQMCSTPDVARNVARAESLIAEAVGAGATFVALPELFNRWGSAAELREGAEPLDGPTLTRLREVARGHAITLLAGSIVESGAGDALYNASCLIGADGDLLATYRKIHLFDVDVPGAVHRESATITPGADVVVTETAGLRIGQATCYDLRFPELFRALLDRGAEVVVLPSAFTAATGKDHWEPLIRARAIENQVYVIAPNQRGSSNEKLHWHGRSMIVDPWGVVLAQAPDRDVVITAEIDLDAQQAIRAKLPSGDHRRPELF
jgi:deaminated glutathione amidase